jgi:pyruvate dehydrogenase E2 component (dihydrolipoamide acetyltransferase)
MAEAILMPRQGQSVESCIIGAWHKQKGDKVNIGDKLFTYETDKATFDEEAEIEGTLIAVFFEEGDDVPVLRNVCVIGNEGEDWEPFIPEGATADGATADVAADETIIQKPEEEKSKKTAAEDREPAEVKDALPAGKAATVIFSPEASAISPRAKRLADKAGADLRFAVPTGPYGRLIERDVQILIEQGHLYTAAAGSAYDITTVGSGLGGRVSVADTMKPQAAPGVPETGAPASTAETYRDVKLPQIRKIIAKAMYESLSTMAQLTLNASFDATDLIELRKHLKEAAASEKMTPLGLAILDKVPTVNDLILFAVSRVAKKHPESNAHFLGDTMRYFDSVNLGVAVDTPRGLMVPVVRAADTLSVSGIGKTVRELAGQAQTGTISPDHLQGGTITVTNLGGLGIESFTPVINPPETCILGVNAIRTAVRESEYGVETYPEMTLSLTIDHRAWDGAPAARFLRDVCLALENISLFLINGN